MAVEFGGVDYTNASAVDIIKAILKPYGLDSLGPEMYDVGKTTGSADAAYIWLKGQPKYKEQFPGMALREQNNLAPIDEQTYIAWKSQMTETMRQNGIPPGFYDSPDDFATFIGNGVSAKEVEDRVVNGVVASRNAPQEVKDKLFEYYGIDEGHLAAYWIDPSAGAGERLLRQQAATFAGAAASRARFEGLTRQDAEGLGLYKRSQEELESGFSDIVQGQELMQGLSSEGGVDQFTKDEQLQYVAGNKASAIELAQRANKRKAAFAGGGGFAESATGVTGLGSET